MDIVSNKVCYRALIDLDTFTGLDGVEYTLSKGDTVTLPEEQGDLLVKNGALKRFEIPVLKKPQVVQTVKDFIDIDNGAPPDIEWVYPPEEIDNADRDSLFSMVNRFEKLGAKVPKNIDVYGTEDLRSICNSWNIDERMIANSISEVINKSSISCNGFDYHLTDTGNSERLIRQYGDRILYCTNIRKWYVWNGDIWIQNTVQLLEYATETAKGIYEEAAFSHNKLVAAWAIDSESLRHRKSMIDGAIIHVPVDISVFDAHPHLFNCRNGTLDILNFKFREFDKEDYLTMKAGVSFDPEASCPKWIEHVNLIFEDNKDMINAFQEICGYSLQQYNPDQVVFFLWGNGKNGKSETMKVLSHIFGSYARNIESSTLMQSKYAETSKPRPDLIRLKGARFVTVTEPGENDELSEPLIKSFTGDSTITARPLRADPIEFRPGAKVFISTNYKPKIRGQDEGIWRRIWLFPFNVTIPAEKRQADYGDYLFDNEGSGILNWMLQGLKRYRDRGELEQPEVVQNATQQYRIESNALGQFINEMCLTFKGCKETISRKEFYHEYGEWCESVGWKPVTKNKVNEIMRTMFDEVKSSGVRKWVGIRVKYVDELEKEDDSCEVQSEL